MPRTPKETTSPTKPLSPKERAFVAAVTAAEPMDHATAYRAVYAHRGNGATAQREGFTVATRPHVAAAIEAAYADRQVSNHVSVTETLDRFAELLRNNPIGSAVRVEHGRLVIDDTADMSRGALDRITSIKQTEKVLTSGDGEQILQRTLDVRTTPTLEVLRELAKILGLHKVNALAGPAGPSVVIIGDNVTVTGLPDEPTADVPSEALYTPPKVAMAKGGGV